MAPPTPISTRNVKLVLLGLMVSLIPALSCASDGPKPVKPGDPYISLPLDKLAEGLAAE